MVWRLSSGKFQTSIFEVRVSSMSAKAIVSGIVVSLIVAGLAFGMAGSLGVDATVLAVTAALSGIVSALVAGSMGGSSASVSRPRAVAGSAPASAGAQSADDGDKVTLFVGNLAFKANRNALFKFFSEYGEVYSARIMVDRTTRRPRGYGFVEMDKASAEKAMAEADGEMFFGRKLKVMPAKEREE